MKKGVIIGIIVLLLVALTFSAVINIKLSKEKQALLSPVEVVGLFETIHPTLTPEAMDSFSDEPFDEPRMYSEPQGADKGTCALAGGTCRAIKDTCRETEEGKKNNEVAVGLCYIPPNKPTGKTCCVPLDTVLKSPELFRN